MFNPGIAYSLDVFVNDKSLEQHCRDTQQKNE